MLISRLPPALPNPPLPGIKVDIDAASAPAMTIPRTQPLVSPVPLPCRAVKRTVDALADDDGLWHCSLGCGTQYEKSSGRSIRRHMTSCFRSHWPGGLQLSESEVQALMSTQQESGQLVTGLRRWKKRQSCRAKVDIHEDETWTCLYGCNKVYRLTSSRSIQQHLLGCAAHAPSSIKDHAPTNNESPTEPHDAPTVSTSSLGDLAQAVEHRSDTLAFPILSPVSIPTTPDSVPELDIELTGYNTAHAPTSLGRVIPGQFDGMDDASFMEESNYSHHAMPVHFDDNMHNLLVSPTPLTAQYPLFAHNWEDTPLRVLLRRHQAELQQISARHTTEIIALHERVPVDYTKTTCAQAYPAPLPQAQ